ncbi:hypothetical protein R9C00_03470 [Flammeovirgaceae bacterium SG7u.111]|nr:hypothetical protein [Flammeovirgaceae bacterium SG7u.132]WPO36503.1 hypothetical protein R9C00_03470 [Flammeovirgaceae bacterium SG7u.111]
MITVMLDVKCALGKEGKAKTEMDCAWGGLAARGELARVRSND